MFNFIRVKLESSLIRVKLSRLSQIIPFWNHARQEGNNVRFEQFTQQVVMHKLEFTLNRKKV